MSTVRLSLFGDCVIHVNDTAVDPSSTHLFALLLVLALEKERRVPRAELHRLLFPTEIEPTHASHNLRQLLYRLRRLGAVLDESASGLRLKAGCCESLLEHVSLFSSGDCELLADGHPTFLPAYTPKLPRAYLEWLDHKRDSADNISRASLSAAIARLRNTHDWTAAYRASSALAAVDPLSEAAVAVMAESLTMLGRRDEALLLLTSFGDSTSRITVSPERLRPLRARISRLGNASHDVLLRGRNECLASIDGEWRKLGREGGRRVTLIGHGGIGKTRVAEAFAARAQLAGGHVTRYNCDAASAEQPLGLFSDILPELRGLRGSIGASPELSSALDRLRPVTSPNTVMQPSDISVEGVRSELQRALIDLLEAVSEDKPLLLLVDDAHYLDRVSANVIRALSTSANSACVLVLLCIRPSNSTASLLEPVRRGMSCVLEPLPADVSRQVVLDIAGHGAPPDHVEWCLTQAAGNPFYLHTLASPRFATATLVPFDIRSMAANAYNSLAVSSRSVLESCLLLGRLASLARVQTISRVTDDELLSSLRELEQLDLIEYGKGVLSGPHALLHDALIALIPSSVAAVLHMRIARSLEDECEATQYVFAVAWAAAQSWLEAGDPHAAAALIRRCAHHAALLGEPTAATTLLARVVSAPLPPAVHAGLLDELMEYASASGSRSVLVSAIRKRLQLGLALNADPHQLKGLEVRLIEAELASGGKLSLAIEPLLAIMEDSRQRSSLRSQAAAQLMIIADLDLNELLARRVLTTSDSLADEDGPLSRHRLRTAIVFHTSFGEIEEALTYARATLSSFPRNDITPETIQARNYAAYTLFRLRDLEAASVVTEENYLAMRAQGLANQALYSASIRTEIALTQGDFAAARRWHEVAREVTRGGEVHELIPMAGLYANEAIMALYEGKYTEAERLFFAPTKDFAMLSADRYRAISLAHAIRIRQLRGDHCVGDADVSELIRLYSKGRNLGGQDLIVEVLWCDLVIANDPAGASQFLQEYLTRHRREQGQVDWSLLHATSADDAWY